MTERLEQRTYSDYFGDVSWYQESKESGEPQESRFSNEGFFIQYDFS